MNVMVITYRSELILCIVGVDALCLPCRSQWSHWAIGFGGRCLYLLSHLASPSLLVGLFVCLLLRQNLVLNPTWPQNCSVFLVSLLSAEITDMPPWVAEVYVLNILKHVGNTSKLRLPICFTKQVEENSGTSWQYGDWWWRHKMPTLASAAPGWVIFLPPHSDGGLMHSMWQACIEDLVKNGAWGYRKLSMLWRSGKPYDKSENIKNRYSWSSVVVKRISLNWNTSSWQEEGGSEDSQSCF